MKERNSTADSHVSGRPGMPASGAFIDHLMYIHDYRV